jgi:MFS family permease
MANGFGQIVGPLFAGGLNDKVGFRYTCDIIALCLISFFFIYFIFCGGVSSLIRSIHQTRYAWKHGSTMAEDDALLAKEDDDLFDPDREEKTTTAGDSVDYGIN